MNRWMVRIGVIGFWVSCIGGCTVGPDYKAPSGKLPASYLTHSSKALRSTKSVQFGETQRLQLVKEIPQQWWTLFHSKSLNELVLASFKHNPSVDVAKATVHGALETLYAQQGALLPFVGASFAPTKQQTARLLTSVLASNQYNYALYTGQVFVSYTPDVFGGIRRQLESLGAQVDKQRFQLQATYVTLASNVVNAAIQEAALREQMAVIEVMIANQLDLLKIVRQQRQAGDVASVTILQQEGILASIQAMRPPLEKQLALQRDALYALIGRFPDGSALPKFTFDSLTLPTDLPLSLPSKLLEHRPDVQAAEADMRSANALIGVAVANRLPNVTIGFTNAGTAATSIGTLLESDTNFWALAGIITQPIFDGGTLLHRQRAAQALYEQAAAQYRATVIQAFQNVTDSLKALQLDGVALALAANAERASKKNAEIARQQWVSGDISRITLLTNEQLHQQARLNLIIAQANRLSDTVALFQALGGGWWVE